LIFVDFEFIIVDYESEYCCVEKYCIDRESVL
jgi:hypothetical protein